MFSQVSVIPFGGGVEGGVSSDDYQASPAGGGYVWGGVQGEGDADGYIQGGRGGYHVMCVCVCVCTPTHPPDPWGVKLLEIE